jgi:ketosteroid isomerase-like protein
MAGPTHARPSRQPCPRFVRAVAGRYAEALPGGAWGILPAMSQEKIEQLRAAYELFNQTGEIVVAHLAPDFEMQQASSIIDSAGVFHGPNAFRDVLRELAEAFEDFRAEAEGFIEAPTGEIVVLVHVLGRGRGSGAAMDNRIAHVWTYRDDKAVRMVAYEQQADALAAAGVQ